MSTPADRPAPTPALTRGQRRLFTAIMLLLPVAFFALLEGGLRLAGYGAEYPLFEPVVGYEAYQVQDREVARRYFVRQKAVPNSLFDAFPVEKRPGELRVFVQGGSSAAGFPFYRGGAFSRMLEQRLQQSLPDRPVEVVNTAMAAVNSYTLLDLAGEILAQQPDAVLIYAGHNEYYGALGAASAETAGRSRTIVRAYLALVEFRTVQLIRNLFASLASAPAAAEAGQPGETLMARMVGEQQVPLGGETYRAGLEQYRDNLGRLLAFYEQAGVPVYVGTLVANERDHRPFLTVFQDETDQAAWQAEIDRGRAAGRQSNLESAISAFQAATRRDTLAADGFFYLARALQATGRTADARRAFARASDLDALRFRAPSAFNDEIRALAAQHGATVVEVQAAFHEASPEGIVGRELMLEHLHPTLEGYAVMADAFYDALVDAGALGPDARPVTDAEWAGERLVTPLDSLAGYARVASLMQNWPFRPGEAPDFRLDLSESGPLEDRLASQLIDDSIPWAQAVDELGEEYERRGLAAEALRLRFAVIQEYPYAKEPYLQAGNLMLRIAQATGDDARRTAALSFYEAAMDRDSTDAALVGLVGALYLQADERARATDLLERAYALDPSLPQVAYNLAGAYAQAGRYGDARRMAGAVPSTAPQHADAQRLLRSLPR
jgi:tetratricopeptide (TPR) repeat protein